MAIIAVLADPNDGSLESSTWKHQGGLDANPDFESDARRGEGATYSAGQDPDTGARLVNGGQKWNNGDQTLRYETFVMFRPSAGFAVPPGIGQIEVVTSSLRVSRGKFVYDNPNDSNFGAKDSLAIWNNDWNAPLSASAWFDLMAVSGSGVGTNYQPEAELAGWVQDRTASGILYEGGGEVMLTKVRDHLAAGTDIGYVMFTWTATQVYPANQIWLVSLISSTDVLFAPKYHPTLQVRAQRKHALNYVGGASIQMTDGTAVFLRYDDATKKYNLYYQKVNQTTPTLIDFLKGKVGATDNSGGAAQYFGHEPAFQAYGLTRDDQNNIYVMGPRGNPQTGTYGQKVANVCAYKYTGNYTWSRFTQTTTCENTLSDTDTHRGFINNLVPVWLPGGPFPSGRLAAVHSRRDGQWGRYQMGVHSMVAGWATGEAGAARTPSRAYAGDDAAVTGWWRSYNPSGSNLDAFRDGDNVRIASAVSALGPDETERSGGLTCAISSANVVGKPTLISSSLATNSPHDPDAKMRAVWLGEGSPYWAVARYGHIQILRKSDGAIVRQIDLPSNGVSGFPARSVLQKSQAWDVIWDSNDKDWIWTYYRDAANPRVINKVRYNFMTGALDTAFQFTAAPLGASGSEIVAIRVPRQQVDARCVLVDVAMQDGAGTPTALLTLRDTTMNKPPSKPVLDAVNSFNATSTKQIDWTFQDNNPSDFPTFQSIEIRNIATGATSLSVTHTALTVVNSTLRKYRYTIAANALTNDATYQVRVLAFDSVDAPSEWSDWVQFSTTSTGGSVVITEPATDNEPLNKASFDVKWTYSNTNPAIVQTGYRVRVYNNETGVSVSDSTLVTSTATTYAISGLTSDIEYRVEVTIKDSNNQTSGAGIRLVTPDFNNPSLPEIRVFSGPGYIEIRVTNPPPDGDNPVTIKNQIARKELDQPDESYVVIGECPPNGVYRDWTVASGVEYTYKARGSSE